MERSTIVITIIVFYFMAMVLIAWYAGKTVKDSTDYMAGGRKMPLWLTTGALIATFICGGTIMGGAGAAYGGGFFATIPDPFACAVALVIAGLFYMGITRKTKIISAGSFYRSRFGPRAAAASSICMIPTYLMWTAVQIMAIGKLFQVLIGWDYVMSAIIGGAILILYTFWGGMVAVVWTDTAQFIILFIGTLALLPYSIDAAGGMANIRSAVPPDFFSLAPKEWSVVGLLTYSALWIGIGTGSLPCPDLMQRSFVAKTPKVAKWAGVWSGILMALVGVVVVIIGISGVYLGNIGVIDSAAVSADPEMVVPLLAKALMNPYLLGFFFSALLAAIMSSAVSALFAPATILSNDVLKPMAIKRGRDVSDKTLLRWTKYAVLGIGFGAMLIGLVSDSLYIIMIIAFTLIGSVLFFPYTFGLYWKKANEYGAVAGMVVGAIIPIAMMIFQGSVEPEPYWALVFFPLIGSLVAMVTVSLATQHSCPPKPLKTEDGEIIKWPELDTEIPSHKGNIGETPSI